MRADFTISYRVSLTGWFQKGWPRGGSEEEGRRRGWGGRERRREMDGKGCCEAEEEDWYCVVSSPNI
jgi:hypothetical protein